MVLVALCAVLLGGCGSESSETSQPDPCKVFTADQVRSFIAAGSKPFPTGTGEGCSFGSRKDDRATTLLINVVPGDTPAKFDESKAVAGAVIDVPGIGDQAFAYGNVSTRVQSAEARKGDLRTRILLEGPLATQQKATEALQLAVDRL